MVPARPVVTSWAATYAPLDCGGSDAAVASKALDAEDVSAKDRDFYEGKIAAASFFARNVLPKIAAERHIAESTDNALMDVPESAF